MAYWQPLRGIQDPIPIRQFDGVYKPDDPGFNLSDNLFTDLINFSPDAYPAIKTMPGNEVLGAFGSGIVLGMGAWKDKELHVLFNDGSWRKWNGTSWTTLLNAGTLNTTDRSSFVNFQGNLSTISLIMANGVDPVKYYDGSTVQNLSNAPSGSKFIEQHDNRVYVATGNIVNFSALRKPTDWTTVNDAGQIVVETPDGENITALKAGPKHLIVFKPNNMFDLLGSGPSDYTLVPIAADIGAINNNCVVNIGGMVYFLHTTGVYSYSSARPKNDFCKPIMQYIKRINLNSLDKCSVGTDGLHLYVSLPLDTSTTPNIILQYDLSHGTWYTWADYSAVNFAFIEGSLYIGNANGQVRRVTGTTNNGSAIVATAITKPFTNDSIARRSEWFKIWVVASAYSTSTLTISTSRSPSGDSDWQKVKVLSLAAGTHYKMVLVPTNGLVNVNVVRIKLVCTGNMAIHEISRQLRILPMK